MTFKDVKIKPILDSLRLENISDAIYFSEKNIPTILMNPKGANWHGKDEYVEIESLYTLYKIFKTLL